MNANNLVESIKYVTPLNVDSNIWTAWKAFKDHQVDYLPVSQNQQVIGVLLREDMDALRKNYNLKDVEILGFISKEFIILNKFNDSLEKQLKELSKEKTKRILFAGSDSNNIGVLSVLDVLSSVLAK